MMEKIAAIFLGINAALFILVGGLCLLDLSMIVSYLGLEMSSLSANATNDLRANYGGLYLGLGILLARAAWQQAWRSMALICLATLFAGVVIGRLVDLMQHGLPATQVMIFLVTEILTTLISLGLWWRIKPQKP